MPNLTDFLSMQQDGTPEVPKTPSSLLDLLIPSAQAQTGATKPRYHVQNGKIYDHGIAISKEEAIGTLTRQQQTLLRNAQQLQSSPPDLRPVLQRAHDLAKSKMEAENAQIMSAIKALELSEGLRKK